MDDQLALGGTPALREDLETLKHRFNPAQERLWAKIAGLTQDLESLAPPDPGLIALRDRSLENVRRARACIEESSRHPHLAWRFLHRVDEDLVLLAPLDRLKASALDVKTSFELNITEPSVRAAWLGAEGGKGSLVLAIEKLEGGGGKPADDVREVVRAALQMVNEQVDRRFWTLSTNVLTTVSSGVLLALTILTCGLLWAYGKPGYFAPVTQLGSTATADFLPIALLGVMGSYTSNLLTREDFLFVRGGPWWRFLLHPLAAKPILSAFAALFVYVLARSEILFALHAADPARHTGTVLSLGVPATGEAEAFAYVVLAIVSGFAADKVLRSMIDRVLKRLEDTAEKTSKTEEGKG